MLLRNLLCASLAPASIARADLRIGAGLITERGTRLKATGGEEVIDCSGKIALPGFVCAHTHLYSSLSRGMPGPRHRPANFFEILREVWWKLDRALDDESIYASAVVGALEAVRCGTTAVVDHHASPNAIPGSLDVIAEGLERVGLRGVLCYEVTDRGGKRERDDGLRENERFIGKSAHHPLFRGVVGAHACFTLSNESLRMCGDLAASSAAGVHIHLAEDRCDCSDAEENYRSGIVDRLEAHGLLRDRSIFAHGVHLSTDDLSRIRRSRSWLVHNPRSNMNNRVGRAPVERFGNRAALGTDGFPADMIEEAAIGFLAHQADGRGTTVQAMTRLLRGGQELIGEIFGTDYTTLSKGAAADLVILSYPSPTPLTKENLDGQLLFGMRSSMVESVMVNGRWVMKDRALPGIDVPSVMEHALKCARKLWTKMERLKG